MQTAFHLFRAYNLIFFMERYRSGHNEPHSKCGCPATGTWVRIPSFPPRKEDAKRHLFFLERKFIKGFERVGIGNLKVRVNRISCRQKVVTYLLLPRHDSKAKPYGVNPILSAKKRGCQKASFFLGKKIYKEIRTGRYRQLKSKSKQN